MKARGISRAWRAAAVFAWLLHGAGCTGTSCDSPKSVTQPAEATRARVDKVVVYYFHNTRRCPTCLGIQKGIEDVMDGKFKDAIDAGMLDFRELNMEEDANLKYVEQFQLSFGTMVVAANAGEDTRKWENAKKVWELAHSEDELRAYVERIISLHLDLIGRTL